MLPIAIAFDCSYIATAVAWRSPALAGGAAAVTVYVVALLLARRELALQKVGRAAVITAIALLLMISIGAVFLHFQLAALVLIAIAAVVVVLPHVERRTLVQLSCFAVAVIVEIVVLDGMLAPLVDQPPMWFQHVVLGSAVVAASVLILIMLSADEERMRDLVRASRASAAEAHRARRATETFLIAAAHQLRTPVSTVLLQSETVLADRAEVDPQMRTRLERVVRQATRLQQVVDKMLDVSHASAGTLQLELRQVDVASIVRDVVRDLGRTAADAGAVIEVDAPPELSLLGDAQRLARVTSNLLDNAIKFGGGTSVQVSLREEGPNIVLSVSDGGPGMTGAERERCFERNLPLASPDDGGLGVSLWLVRELSRVMGGDVFAHASSRSGTMFVVRIPRRRT